MFLSLQSLFPFFSHFFQLLTMRSILQFHVFQLATMSQLASICLAFSKENRIYIRVEFTKKRCKTAILLYCFYTAGLLHIFVLYNLLGPGTSFNGKSNINIKRKPNYKIGWIHNWPMIISHRLFHLLQTMIFRYNYKSNDGFYSPSSFYKVYLTALKNSKLKWIVQGTYCINVLYCI